MSTTELPRSTALSDGLTSSKLNSRRFLYSLLAVSEINAHQENRYADCRVASAVLHRHLRSGRSAGPAGTEHGLRCARFSGHCSIPSKKRKQFCRAKVIAHRKRSEMTRRVWPPALLPVLCFLKKDALHRQECRCHRILTMTHTTRLSSISAAESRHFFELDRRPERPAPPSCPGLYSLRPSPSCALLYSESGYTNCGIALEGAWGSNVTI